jgi:ubiquinol-cytochrome c reductase cytochrome b subunit
MLMWHIVLLPIGVALIAGLHVLLVRRHGIVPPFADKAPEGYGDVGPATAAPPSEPA